MSETPEPPPDITPRICQCDGELVEQDQDGIWCLKCGRRKVKR